MTMDYELRTQNIYIPRQIIMVSTSKVWELLFSLGTWLSSSILYSDIILPGNISSPPPLLAIKAQLKTWAPRNISNQDILASFYPAGVPILI